MYIISGILPTINIIFFDIFLYENIKNIGKSTNAMMNK